MNGRRGSAPPKASADKLPFMKVWISDWLAAFAELDGEQRGALASLWLYMWQEGGRPYWDDARLARRAGIDLERWPAVWAAISHFFLAIDSNDPEPYIASPTVPCDVANARSLWCITSPMVTQKMAEARSLIEARIRGGINAAKGKKALKAGTAGGAEGRTKRPSKRQLSPSSAAAQPQLSPRSAAAQRQLSASSAPAIPDPRSQIPDPDPRESENPDPDARAPAASHGHVDQPDAVRRNGDPRVGHARAEDNVHTKSGREEM